MKASAQHSVAFFRRSDLPGVELMDAILAESKAPWFHTCFALGLAGTWQGEVRYQCRTHAVTPGTVLCAEPGEVTVPSRVVRAGSMCTFMFDSEMLGKHIHEHHRHTYDLQWTNVVIESSPRLVERLTTLRRAFVSGGSSLELWSAFVGLVDSLVRENFIGLRSANGPAVEKSDRRAKGPPEEPATSSIGARATNVGMSRFQALRAFKRRHGLPPLAYELCERIARSRVLLVRGHSPSDVAAECGFVDQSHFARHFKRLVGVSPMVYARAQGRKEACDILSERFAFPG